jgi:hypothetical protein
MTKIRAFSNFAGQYGPVRAKKGAVLLECPLVLLERTLVLQKWTVVLLEQRTYKPSDVRICKKNNLSRTLDFGPKVHNPDAPEQKMHARRLRYESRTPHYRAT